MLLPERQTLTPYELWNGIKPGISSFHIFGSKCFVHVQSAKRGKLDNVATEMIFLGYDENSKAYRCYNTSTYKVVISRDVRFGTAAKQGNEIMIDLGERQKTSHDEERRDENATLQGEKLKNDHEDSIDVYDSAEDEMATEVHESEEHDNQVQPVQRVSRRASKGIPAKRLIEEIHMVRDINEPRNYDEAIQSDERVQWYTSMQEEIEAHNHNGTWELVDLPPGKTAIGSKWVFKVKTNVDGEIERYKARFVAQGFGEDYDEVFAPVVLHTTFRILLSVAAKRRMLVHHFDAKTAFLNGKLKETIYMKQPPGFDDENTKVCLLKKNIYGLKQAARSWNTTLHKVLMDAGFQQSYNDCTQRILMMNLVT